MRQMPVQEATVLKAEPDELQLQHHSQQHHQPNYQPIHAELFRTDVPVQQQPSQPVGRQFQSVSPLTTQESHQRFEIPSKKRVYFTPEQRGQLEELYKNQQYPTRDDKSALAKSLNIDENKIQVWFQNRRARDRRPRCTRRKMRASHGLHPLNLFHNMAPYSSPNLFQNLNQHQHEPTATLAPYAGRQLGLGWHNGMNIFGSNWPAQSSIQNTTAPGSHHFTANGQTRTLFESMPWSPPYSPPFQELQQQQQQHQHQQSGLNSRAASDNSFDGTQKNDFTPENIEQI